MKPGIKVGPQTWRKILSNFTPQVCEIWYRVDWEDKYKEMFGELKSLKIPTGLHFWGMLPGGITPNFAFPDEDIRQASLELVKKNINVASKNGFKYVNIHPGSYCLVELDLDKQFMRPIKGRKTSPSEGEKMLFENIGILDEYARKQGVNLVVETIPSREPEHWRDLMEGRLKAQETENVPVSVVEKLAKQGFYICNDFMHTAMDEISDDRDYLFKKLFNKSKRLAKQTKLLHVNTSPPPFNGTDGHLGIRKQDFKTDVFPSREQYKKLLSIFKGRDDVWVIPEPFSYHIENTESLIELLEEIGE